jgi:uncharacterized protein YndB with AHSA1/START domain
MPDPEVTVPTTTETARFDQPPEEVFDALVEPERLAAFTHAFDHAERAGSGPLTPGTHVRIEARVDGRPAELELEVVELDPPRALVVRGGTGELATTGRLELVAVDGGTQVTATSTSASHPDDEEAVDPEVNPAFADVGSSLLAGLRAALGDTPPPPS